MLKFQLDSYLPFTQLAGCRLTVILQEIHSRLQRHVRSRLASLDKGEGIDWATAEVRGCHSLEKNIESMLI